MQSDPHPLEISVPVELPASLAKQHGEAMVQPSAIPSACVSSKFESATASRLEGLIPEMRVPYPTSWLHNQPAKYYDPEINEYEMGLYGVQIGNEWQLCQQLLLEFGGKPEVTAKRMVSNSVGHARVKVNDVRTGMELFQIRRARAKINPKNIVGRETYRITKPGNDEGSWNPLSKSDQVLYTLNRDYFGKGFAWKQPEWYIYKGHKKDGHLLYYCQGDHPWSWNFRKGNTSCWHSKEGHDARQPPVMAMQRMRDMKSLSGATRPASTFNVTFDGLLGVTLKNAAAGGTVVTTVDSSSAAAKAGIPSGAFIVGVGDRDTSSFPKNDVIALIRSAIADGPFTVTFGLPELAPSSLDSLMLNIGPNEDAALLLAFNAISFLCCVRER